MPSIIVFPGQGSQYVGMCKNLLALPKVQQMFEIGNEVFKTNLLSLCVDGPKKELDKTINCQPAVFIASMAAIEQLKNSEPNTLEDCYATAGFSIGEYSSLVLSGAMTFEDAIRVIKVRADAMQAASEQLPSGLMTAMLTRQSKLSLAMLGARKWCKDKLKMNEPIVCQISNHLNAKCKVVGGNKEALDFIELNYKEFDILKVKRLPVSGAFHTQLMKSAEEPLSKALKSIPIKKPLIRCYFNYDSKEHITPEKIRYLLTKQVSNPVKWEQTLNELYYDHNLPADEDYSLLKKQEQEAHFENIISDSEIILDKDTESRTKNKSSKAKQSSGRIYPDIIECGPAAHTGPVLKTLNHRAYRYYKFIEA